MTNPKHTDTSRSGALVERLRRRMNKPDGTKRRPSPRELEAADRIEALEAALSWSLIQLGSETGYNMESPIWHAYDRARDVLNGVRK